MSKAFKYRKQGEQYTLKINKEGENLFEQLRNEHLQLTKQAEDLELKKQCIEEKMRELSLNQNESKQQIEYVYANQQTENDESNQQQELCDYMRLLPDKPFQEKQKPQLRSLFEYFNYKNDTIDKLNEMSDIQQLADQFGIKSNNLGKAKQQLKIINEYLTNQQYPEQWRKFYSNNLFEKLIL